MKNLSRIHLDYNQLEFLPKDFSLMTQLKKLTITNNQIHAIDWWSFQKLNFQQLQVAKNPFDCSCNNYELRSWSEIFMNPKETQDRILNYKTDRFFRLPELLILEILASLIFTSFAETHSPPIAQNPKSSRWIIFEI